MFEATVEREGEGVAQQYKGGVYDRSLAPDVVPAAPAGDYADLSSDDLSGFVRRRPSRRARR